MNKRYFAVAFAVGLAVPVWVGIGFVGSSALALVMTALIGAVYLLGALELRQFRAASAGLAAALSAIPQPLARLGDWLEQVPPTLRNAVRQRIEAERGGLPGPALTPYLVGLLVMLGMLGTFLGMIVTFKGAVFAMEGSTDLQAIRAALAEPIKGLGLAFGTSVAGVAASAMLGLMSALSRRERMEVARRLDGLIATALRPFSRGHQREETLRTLQAQAGALPTVVDQLSAMMERIEQRARQLDEQLLERQAQFHREAGRAYTELAGSVGASLRDNVAAGTQAASASIQPVVQAAMAQLLQDSQRLHERLGSVAQQQVDDLSQQFAATAASVSDGWRAALQDQARTSTALTGGLQQTLAAVTDAFEQRSTALLTTVHERLAAAQSDQASGEQTRLLAWTEALQALATDLHGQWQRVGDETIAHQRAVCLALERTAGEVTERASVQAGQGLEQVAQLLARSEALVESRIETEAQWLGQHGERMEQLLGVWRTELAALRQEEARRGQAAVERLGELQAAVASHLESLGASLEAPITRLLQTASEVPQAAAGLLLQLREETSRLAERDTAALQEREALLAKIGALLEGVDQGASRQGAAIEALVASASTVLAQAGGEFAGALQSHGGKAADMTAQVAASAIELASLGEAFGHGVQLFQASNDKLLEGLQRIETSLNRSTERSDEQLAYFVAQAREVIDLSIASQQGLVENMRQLQGQPLALASGGRA